MLGKTIARNYERFVPVVALVILALVVGQALWHSLSAWLSGAELKQVVPVLEAPIAIATGAPAGSSAIP